MARQSNEFWGDVAYVSCVFCCEVCADYEPAEGQLLISQTNDTVLLRCSQDTSKTWTLNCVNGQWTTNNDERPDCRSVTSSAGSGLNTSTDLDTKGSVVNNTFQKYSQYQYIYFMNKKALLSQRRPRDAPNIWVPWKVSRVLANAPGYFSRNL